MLSESNRHLLAKHLSVLSCCRRVEQLEHSLEDMEATARNSSPHVPNTMMLKLPFHCVQYSRHGGAIYTVQYTEYLNFNEYSLMVWSESHICR